MARDEWKTLRVPRESYEKAKEQKQNHDRTWGEQLLCNNTSTTSDNIVETNKDDIVETLLQQVEPQLEQCNNNATIDIDALAEKIVSELDRETPVAQDRDTDGIQDDLDKLKQLVDTIPERTAEEFGSKYR